MAASIIKWRNRQRRKYRNENEEGVSRENIGVSSRAPEHRREKYGEINDEKSAEEYSVTAAK